MDIEVKKLKIEEIAGMRANFKYDPAKFLLSQTVMKAHEQWDRRGLCGKVYEQLLLRNLTIDPSEDMKLGQWFEFQCTAAMPAYGDTLPEPETYKRDSNSNESPAFKKGDIKGNWKHAQAQAKAFHESIKAFGWKIIEAGVKTRREGASGNLDIIIQIPKDRWDEFVGTYTFLDGDNPQQRMVQEYPAWEDCVWRHTGTGEVIPGCVIIDLKFTGMLHEQWGPASWNLDRLPDDQGKMVQALHYHWLSGGLPFFFWVFSSTEPDNRLIRVFFEQSAMPRHIESVAKMRKVIDSSFAISAATSKPAFTPRPGLRQCGQCPLRHECEYRANTTKVFGIFAQ